LFVDVAEQMERLNADIGPVKATLQQAPEVLHGVRVDIAVNVLYRVIDNRMLVVILQTVIRLSVHR
jgi:hypothetical protein